MNDQPDAPFAFPARTWKKYHCASVGRSRTVALAPLNDTLTPLTAPSGSRTTQSSA